MSVHFIADWGTMATCPPRPPRQPETNFEDLADPKKTAALIAELSPRVRAECGDILQGNDADEPASPETEAQQKVWELARALGWNERIEIVRFLEELEIEAGPNKKVCALVKRIRNRIFDTRKIPVGQRTDIFQLSFPNVVEMVRLEVFKEGRDHTALLKLLKDAAEQAGLDPQFLEQQGETLKNLQQKNFEDFTRSLREGEFCSELVVGMVALQDQHPNLKCREAELKAALTEWLLHLIETAARHSDIGITIKPKTMMCDLRTVLDAVLLKRKTLHLSSFEQIDQECEGFGITREEAITTCINVLRLIRLRVPD